MTTILLVHYQELVLKGRNRPWFVDRLLTNLRLTTGGLGVAEVRPVMGRIEIRLHPGAAIDEVIERVGRTLGVSSVSSAVAVAPRMEAIVEAALSLTEGLPPATFRVSAARADKAFPVSSPEIERQVGAAVHMARGWPVDLSSPSRRIHVEVLAKDAYVAVDRRCGPAGLPVGVSGRVACLISGGIDSPVAAYRLMRRGCRVVFIHFHSYPVTTDATREKVRRLVGVLTRAQLRSRLLLVPFADLQKRIVVSTPPPLRVVLYRRFMLRVGAMLARRSNARALVTGEVIGQVASQTLENLATIDRVCPLPVLRPLVGMDKEEISAEARRLGTFDISILPDEDCCQVYAPRHPAINVSVGLAEEVERALDVDAMVQDCIDRTARELFAWSPEAGDVVPVQGSSNGRDAETG